MTTLHQLSLLRIKVSFQIKHDSITRVLWHSEKRGTDPPGGVGTALVVDGEDGPWPWGLCEDDAGWTAGVSTWSNCTAGGEGVWEWRCWSRTLTADPRLIRRHVLCVPHYMTQTLTEHPGDHSNTTSQLRVKHKTESKPPLYPYYKTPPNSLQAAEENEEELTWRQRPRNSWRHHSAVS